MWKLCFSAAAAEIQMNVHWDRSKGYGNLDKASHCYRSQLSLLSLEPLEIPGRTFHVLPWDGFLLLWCWDTWRPRGIQSYLWGTAVDSRITGWLMCSVLSWPRSNHWELNRASSLDSVENAISVFSDFQPHGLSLANSPSRTVMVWSHGVPGDWHFTDPSEVLFEIQRV